MTEIKGKFIMLTKRLVEAYPGALDKADQQLFTSTGKHCDELDPEGWYDTQHYRNFISAYVEASPAKEEAMITLGKNIYPTIKRTAGFPPELITPMDYLQFESRGYTENLRGPGVEPRVFTKNEKGHVIIRTKMLEQHCKVLEGVYMGIMKLAGVSNSKIEQKTCYMKGHDVCEFHITW